MWTEITGAELEKLAKKLAKPVKSARFRPLNDCMDLLEAEGVHYFWGESPTGKESFLELTEDVLWRFRALAR